MARERMMDPFIAYVSLKCGRGLLGFRPPSCKLQRRFGGLEQLSHLSQEKKSGLVLG